MTCKRCEGLMVQDDLLDLEDLGGGPWIRAWRCINCGAIVEDTIRVNRFAGYTRAVLGGTSVSNRPLKKSNSRSKPVRKETGTCPR